MGSRLSIARSCAIVAASLIAFNGRVNAQSASVINAVNVQATVQSSPASITLSWPALSGTTSITIYRKLKSATSWGSAYASPGASATSYQDNAVAVGTYYEYKVVRSASGGTGYGYIASGIEVQPTDYMGKLILLVDNTFTSSMNAELVQLEQDLKADGWTVLRHDVSRTASVTSIRSIVQSDQSADPTNVKAIYIVGHVPVPYSGNINPDGHSAHLGAWPCDGFYADVNGSWTDASVNSTGGYGPNINVPGDGKFDQSDFPSPVELQIGRIDLYDMPASSISELNLMKNYLNKAHNFKMKGFVPQVRGIVHDNLQWVGNPLAGCAYRILAPLVGASNITDNYPYGSPFHTYVNNQSYLWTYSSGGGLQAMDGSVLTFNGADNIGTTQTYVGSGYQFDGVFNMSFGSYFGDWDNRNNFLKAPLCTGDALTNVWAAIPNWWFHHMGMGDNIGYDVAASMNNGSGLYTPITGGWSSGKVGMGLMGDPTLRMTMVAPPSNLNIGNAGGNASFSWTASTDAVAGYYIYQWDANSVAARVVPTMITGTSYSSPSVPFVAGKQYMVRAVKLTTTNSGSYFNLSLGAIGTAVGGSTPDCLGVPGGSALPGTSCNDGNSSTINDVWSAGCVCTGTPVCNSPTITSTSGAGTVCSGSGLNLAVVATGTAPLSYQWTGTGSFSPNSTSANVNVSGPATGNYQVTVSNACGTAQASVSVTVVNSPTTSNAGADQTFCSDNGNMAGNTPTVGSGLWSQVSGPATVSFGAASSPSCPVYGLTAAGSYILQWTISNGSCPASTDQVTVTRASSITTANAGPDQTICSSTTTLAGNTASSGTGAWTQVSGPACTIATPSSPTSAVSGMSTAGTYVFQWTISSGSCTPSSDQVSITRTASPTTANAGPDQAICSSTTTLAGNTASSGTGAWTQVSGPACTIATPSSPTSAVSGMSTAGTYVFQWTISSGSCTPSSDQVSITRTASPTTANAGPDQAICSSTTTLAGNTASSGTGAWTQVSGPACTIATPSSPTSAVSGMSTAGTYVFQWTISSGSCTPSSDQVSITRTASPTTANAGPDQAICSSTTTLAGNTASSGTGAWTQVSGPACTIATPSSPTSAVSGMSTAGTYVFQWTISSGSCTPSSDQVSITRTASPTTANAGPDQAICSSTTTLAGNTASSGTGAWTQVSGPACTIATPSSPTSAVSGMSTAGTYVFQWTISSGSCTPSSDQVSITRTASPTTANAGPDQAICSSTTTLAGNTASSGTGAWTQVSGPACTIATPSSPTSSVSGMSTAGTYVFQWTISSGSCTPSSDQVSITRTASPTTANAGPDQAICSSTTTLAGNTASSGTGAWTQVSGPACTIATPSSPTSAVSGMSTAGTYVFQWTISSGSCTPSSDQVSITRNLPPNAGINGSLVICASAAPVNLFAQLGGTPQIGGSWTAPGGVSHSGSYDPMSDIPGSYTYTVFGVSPCGNASSVVTVTENSSMTWFQDLDGDGAGDPGATQVSCTQPTGYVSNSNDQCPGDPDKVAPGQCGCGVIDTDTDGDGTANCNDACPNDPSKIAPGNCGCGNAEPGAACNDGNSATVNDLIRTDCSCVGELLDCEGTPGGTALPGTPCDDGDGGTINDVWSAGCVCAGTPVVVDCEGTPGGTALPGTPCDDGDGGTINDVWSAGCVCAGTPVVVDCEGTPGGTALPGTPCDDGDGGTINDVWSAGCVCVGTPVVVDCEGTPGGTALPGTPCDDGDGGTINDVWSAGCVCVGTPVVVDCEGTPGGTALPGTSCDDGDGGTINDVWSAGCVCAGTLLPLDCTGVPGGSALPGTGCDDGDSTTVNDVYQSDCSCAGSLVDCLGVIGGTALPGTLCDDGDPNTISDMWNSSCVCAGTYVYFDCEGTPYGTALPGTACDDGDANTGNDVYQSDCSCAGETIDCLGTIGGTALPGTPCNDGNSNTVNDTWSAGCTCDGTLLILDCQGVPGGTALPGSPCDDGLSITGNDTWQSDCSCEGQLIDCLGVPGGSALTGTPCDDGDPDTGNDVYQNDCSCAGDLLDCLGVPNGTAMPGTACDDGDPGTGDDVYQSDCSCSGELIDCEGVPGGSSLPGAACDDGLASTIDDTWSTDCECTGTLVVLDCLGVPGGGALPGTPCNDGDPNTGDDTWSAGCACVGQTLDCLGVPGGSSVPGTPCSDGDPNTGNDTWTAGCTCVGQILDCLGVPGGAALPGTPCDDGSSGTTGDMWDSGCNCVGDAPWIDCTGTPGGSALPGTPCDDGDPNTDADEWTLDCQCLGSLVDCAGVPGGGAFIDGCGVCAGGTTGNIPDPDSDTDGLLDCADNCSTAYNPDQGDFDGDGIGDACDNCVWVANPDQSDINGNGIGDVCESLAGVEEQHQMGTMEVAPNPTTGTVFVLGAQGDARTLRFHDAAGKLVLELPWASRLELTDLADGIYTVFALDAEGRPLARTRLIRQ